MKKFTRYPRHVTASTRSKHACVTAARSGSDNLPFDAWLDKYSADDGWAFQDELERLISEKYPNADIFSEPSGRGSIGTDYWYIDIGDDHYEFEFDYNEELSMLYADGPIATARYYWKEIESDIDVK